MVDDPNQRPYRANEALARSAPAKPAAAGSDPLAELARLIGQNDPFAEFGRDGQPRVAPPAYAPQPGYAQPTYTQQSAATESSQESQGHQQDHLQDHEQVHQQTYEQPYAAPNYPRQNFGGAPLAADSDLYHIDPHQPVPGYAPAQHAAADPGYAYQDDRYDPAKAQHEPGDADYYEDENPGRRRMGVMVIAGVFALAVIGTAGAFGYRAIFGSSSASSPPPVIKADAQPSKIVPASNKEATNKQITDRVNDRGMGEKLVSREEAPVDIQNKAAGVTGQVSATQGTGVIGNEPKKVRTIVIHPDGQPAAEPTPAAAVAPPPPARPAPRVVNAPQPVADPEPAPVARQPAPRAAAPVQQAAAANANAPLSLNPNASPAPAARPAAPAQRAAAPAARAAAPASNGNGGGSGGYAVQVSSQRSEAEAQAAFASLQAKYPGQLGGKQPVIHRADLGAKGIYFRAMVATGSAGAANDLCTSLKAAGGSCIVQKN